MIKKFFVLALLIISTNSPAHSQPKLLVADKSIIDVGTVYNTGSHVVETFQIVNAGDQPLRINNVRTSCGCTIALLSDSLVNPGRTSKIKVDFNPNGYSGDVVKYIYVMSNDPTKQMTTLQLKMHISYAIESKPNFILFQNAKTGKPDTTSITLTNTSNEVIKITGVETNSKVVFAHFDAVSIKPGESTHLDLYLVGEKAGAVAGEIIIKTTSNLQPTLAVRYYGGVN